MHAAAGVPGAVMRPIAGFEEEKMDMDDEGKDEGQLPVIPPAEGPLDMDLLLAFKYVLQLSTGGSDICLQPSHIACTKPQGPNVQMSRGRSLTSLNIRTEELVFAFSGGDSAKKYNRYNPQGGNLAG